MKKNVKIKRLLNDREKSVPFFVIHKIYKKQV